MNQHFSWLKLLPASRTGTFANQPVRHQSYPPLAGGPVLTSSPGYTSRLTGGVAVAPMSPGFNSHYRMYVQMVSQSMLALASFLRDLLISCAFKIGICVCVCMRRQTPLEISLRTFRIILGDCRCLS